MRNRRLPLVLCLIALLLCGLGHGMMERQAQAAPPGVLRTNLVLRWKYPASAMSTGSVFKVYASADINLSPTNWAVVGEVAGTNLTWNIPPNDDRMFFLVTSSNVYGESGFSVVVEKPPRPLDEVPLGIE